MSVVSRDFVPVSIHEGKCPGDKRHFRGAAREAYGYIKLLAQRHGGFVFASARDIAKHTKNWRKGKEQYSIRQCQRILHAFYVLGILGKSEVRVIRGRKYRGRQFGGHHWWAESHGDVCDFKYWAEYECQNQKSCRQNVVGDVVADVAADAPNVVGDVVGECNILALNAAESNELRAMATS